MADTRSKGTIKKWFDDKGFGFISPEKGKGDLFIHISAFEQDLSRRPQVGDTVFFYVKTDKDGKTKAVDAVLEGVANVERAARSIRRPRTSGNSSKNGLRQISLVVMLIIGAGAAGYSKFFPASYDGGSMQNLIEDSIGFSTLYTCQGKIHCSQMTSCEEAKFYIRNCPNTQMDGDGDGIPCERQWCN